jgi:hypothetical protein
MTNDIRPALAAKPVGEVGEVVAELEQWASYAAGEGQLADAKTLTRAATLLSQQESRIADLRVALAECGRAVGSLTQENCSDSFLFQVPGEIRLAVAKATPPAPESGEVGELVAWLRELGAKRSGVFSVTTFCANLTSAAIRLQQQQHLLGLAGKELAAFIEQQAAPPVVVPVPVAERLPGEGES